MREKEWCGLFDFIFLMENKKNKKDCVCCCVEFPCFFFVVVVGVCVEREIMEWVRVIEKERMGFYCIE